MAPSVIDARGLTKICRMGDAEVQALREVVVDLLSTDVVRVKPGFAALITGWGGDSTLHARVRMVEPSGFTKISALGVEEPRVNVVLDFQDMASGLAENDAVIVHSGDTIADGVAIIQRAQP